MSNLKQARDLIASISSTITVDAAYLTHVQFHKLWSTAPRDESYIKREWMELDEQLSQRLTGLHGHGWAHKAMVERQRVAALAEADKKEIPISIDPRPLPPEVRELMDKIYALLRGKSVEVGINVLLNITVNLVKQTGGHFDELQQFLANMIDFHKAGARGGAASDDSKKRMH